MAAPPTRTVRQLIQKAYQKISVYAAGETIDDDDMNDGLISFQDMLAEWSGDGLLIPVVTQENFSLVAGKATYTIGEDGTPDVDTVRPDQIVNAFIRDSTYDYPVRVIDQRAFSRFGDKSNSGDRPEYLWYNPTSPNGIINLYRPPGSTYDLFIESEKPLTDGAGLTDKVLAELSIPRYYHNPIVYNLALELAPENGVDPSMLVVAKAEKGKDMIRSLNAANKANAISLDFVNDRSGNNDLVRY